MCYFNGEDEERVEQEELEYWTLLLEEEEIRDNKPDVMEDEI